jgi:hypothetical protein
MKKIKQTLISLGVYLTNATFVLAQSPAANPNCKQTDFGCIPSDDPLKFTANLYGIGLGFIGGVALLFIIWGGYLVLSSRGDPSQLQKGRGYIIYSIIGLILAVGGYAFYTIIAKDVVKLPGFG